MNISAKLVNIVMSIPVHSKVYNCTLYVLFLDRSYWSKSWPFASDNFSAIMSSRQFEPILKFLHLNDSEAQPKRGEPAFDKLYKVRPFLDLVMENFQSSYQPHQQISIDESMISYKGRLSFIQYLRNKPHKVVLKARGAGRFHQRVHLGVDAVHWQGGRCHRAQPVSQSRDATCARPTTGAEGLHCLHRQFLLQPRSLQSPH